MSPKKPNVSSDTARKIEEWIHHFESVVRWLLPKSVAGTSRSALTPGKLVEHAVNELWDLRANEPNSRILSLARDYSVGSVGNPTAPSAMEACVELVRSLVWFVDSTVRDGGSPSALVPVPPDWSCKQPDADKLREASGRLRSGLAGLLTKSSVHLLRVRALVELAKIPTSASRNSSEIPDLKPSQKRWVASLAQLLKAGKGTTHAAISTQAGRKKGWSERFPKQMRDLGLIPDEPPHGNKEWKLTELGSKVAEHLLSQPDSSLE